RSSRYACSHWLPRSAKRGRACDVVSSSVSPWVGGGRPSASIQSAMWRPRPTSPPTPMLQQRRDLPALALLAFLNLLQRLGQRRIEPHAQDVDQHGLPQGFGLDRFVRPTVPVAAVVLGDHRQVEGGDLLLSQRDPLPEQLSADLVFKNAP